MQDNPPSLKLRRVKRRGRDSNPRYLAVNTLSKRARSATLTPLLKKPTKKWINPFKPSLSFNFYHFFRDFTANLVL